MICLVEANILSARAVQAKDGELLVLSWVTWPSRSVRGDGSKRVMSDPRMIKLM